jgi:hypothetical protein
MASSAGPAVDALGDHLPEIHLLQSRRPRLVANGASRESLQPPEVGEDTTFVEAETIFQTGFETRDGGRFEVTVPGQRFERAVAPTGWNKNGRRRTALESEVERALGPVDGFTRRQKWRLHQDKDAQVDPVPSQ